MTGRRKRRQKTWRLRRRKGNRKREMNGGGERGHRKRLN